MRLLIILAIYSVPVYVLTSVRIRRRFPQVEKVRKMIAGEWDD